MPIMVPVASCKLLKLSKISHDFQEATQLKKRETRLQQQGARLQPYKNGNSNNQGETPDWYQPTNFYLLIKTSTPQKACLSTQKLLE